MADDEVQMKATLDNQSAIKGLMDLRRALDGLASSSKKLDDLEKKTGKDRTDRLREYSSLLSKLPGGNKLRDVADAYSGEKGAGGGSPIFGRIAAGFAVATAAATAYGMVIEANLARTRAFNDAKQKQFEIFDKTREAQDREAQKGLSQNTDDYRKGRAAGGGNFESYVQTLTKSGVISREAAVSAAASVATRYGDDTKRIANVLQGIILGARVGLSTTDVAKNLNANYGSSGDPASIKYLVALQNQQSTHQFGDPMQILNAGLVNQYTDRFQGAAKGIAGQTAGIPASERGATIAYGARSAGQEAAEARTPGITLLTQTFRDNARVNAQLERLAEAQGPVLGFLANIFKPEGSFETMLRRRQIAWGPSQ
jgi:hypothetical protein